MNKKILFLSFNFPFGPFGPSTNCTARIMEALTKTGRYEIYNISYNGLINNYREINGINIETLPLQAPSVLCSRVKMVRRVLHRFVFFPFTDYFFCRRVYRACKRLIADSQFDLVIAQCNPEESVWTGTWLKRAGIGKRLMVVFWDNIYGKMQFKFIPKRFAIWRQRKAENDIAKYSDLLVSLYPIKSFHEKFGDVSEAVSKRVYLGVPSIIRPRPLPESSYQDVIHPDKINILYSGTVFSFDYVRFVVDLFNESRFAKQINLIFFERGVDLNAIIAMRAEFQGGIEVNDWIPLNELLSVYPSVDFFMSFPGLLTAIRSKVYEYMSYGKPLLLLYDNDSDVNLKTFSRYPAYQAVDMRKPVSNQVQLIDSFIEINKKKIVPFEETELLFPDDSAQSYVRVIDALLD